MALDASGFVRRVQLFAGNASEPTTLKGMLTGLDAAPGATVVMDAGIATEANLLWLREQGLHYVVVSKLRERQFDPALATEVQSAGDVTIKLQRVLDLKTGKRTSSRKRAAALSDCGRKVCQTRFMNSVRGSRMMLLILMLLI